MKIFQLTALAMAMVATSTSTLSSSVYANAIEAEEPYFLEDAIDIDTVSISVNDAYFYLYSSDAVCLYHIFAEVSIIDVYTHL